MKTTIMKIINCAIDVSLIDSFVESLAKKLDHAATTLCEINNKLEEL
jgi:hypothetical protein